jgi:hypothetical protein
MTELQIGDWVTRRRGFNSDRIGVVFDRIEGYPTYYVLTGPGELHCDTVVDLTAAARPDPLPDWARLIE